MCPHLNFFFFLKAANLGAPFLSILVPFFSQSKNEEVVPFIPFSFLYLSLLLFILFCYRGRPLFFFFRGKKTGFFFFDRGSSWQPYGFLFPPSAEPVLPFFFPPECSGAFFSFSLSKILWWNRFSLLLHRTGGFLPFPFLPPLGCKKGETASSSPRTLCRLPMCSLLPS